MDNQEESHTADGKKSLQREKRDVIRKPLRYREESPVESDLKKGGKKKKSKAGGKKKKTKDKKNSNSKGQKKTGKVVKTKGKKKEIKVKRSAVLVNHKRPMSTSNLDSAWRSQVSSANSMLKSSEGDTNERNMQPAEAIPSMIDPSEIGSCLMIAIRDRQHYYLAGTQVKEVPRKFQVQRSPQVATIGTVGALGGRQVPRMETTPTGKGRDPIAVRSPPENNLHSPYNSDRDLRPTPSPKQPSTSNNKGGSARTNGMEVPAVNAREQAVSVTSIIARIPQHILISLDRAKQAMFVLKLVYTKEQIARCSITGTRSEYPSFSEQYGEPLFNTYKAVVEEKFGIRGGQLATLLSKRINYVRHSTRILKAAADKRAVIRLAKVEEARQKELERSMNGEDNEEAAASGDMLELSDDHSEDKDDDEEEEDEYLGTDDNEEEDDGEEDEEEAEEEEDGDSSNVDSDDSSQSETGESSSDSDDGEKKWKRNKKN